MTAREYRIVWRFRSLDREPFFYPQRHRPYRTLAGAMRLFEKLTSNGGRYEKAWDDERGEERTERMVLDYCRLESRLVAEWGSEVADAVATDKTGIGSPASKGQRGSQVRSR